MRKAETLNVRLSGKIIEALDLLVEQGVFTSRSEAVREFLRNHVLERQASRGGK